MEAWQDRVVRRRRDGACCPMGRCGARRPQTLGGPAPCRSSRHVPRHGILARPGGGKWGAGQGRGTQTGFAGPHRPLGRAPADEAGGLPGRAPLTECGVLLPGSISCDRRRQGPGAGPSAAGPAVGRGRGQAPCLPASLADRITHIHPRGLDTVAISTNYCHYLTIVCHPLNVREDPSCGGEPGGDPREMLQQFHQRPLWSGGQESPRQSQLTFRLSIA